VSETSSPTVIKYYPLPADTLAGGAARKLVTRVMKRNGYQFAIDKIAKQELCTRAFPEMADGSCREVDKASPNFRRHFNTATGKYKLSARESGAGFVTPPDASSLAETFYLAGRVFRSFLNSLSN